VVLKEKERAWLKGEALLEKAKRLLYKSK